MSNTLPSRPHYKPTSKNELPFSREVRLCLNNVVDITKLLDDVWEKNSRAVKDDLIIPTYRLQCLEQRLVNLCEKLRKEVDHA